MKKLILLVFILAIIIVVALWYFNHQKGKEDVTSYNSKMIETINNQKDGRLTIEVNDVRKTEDSLIVKYTIEAKEDLYVFVPKSKNCAQIYMSATDLYATISDSCGLDLAPQTQNYLLLKKGESIQLSFDVFNNLDGVKDFSSKSPYLFTSFVLASDISNLKESGKFGSTDVNFYTENGKEYLGTRQGLSPDIIGHYYNFVRINVD